MINNAIASLVEYAVQNGLISEDDRIYSVNALLERMKLDSFTATYNITKLVYFEDAGTEPLVAFEREKQLKGWRRSKKNALISCMNPNWADLYETLF